jgi:RNA polymerase sigma factor (sigma-70 family)
MDDLALLREYADSGSEQAFRRLVDTYVATVYSAARRQVGESMAPDVTQAVFVLLARKSARLRSNTVLTAWLLTTTRFVCRATLRKEILRAHREQEAIAMPHSREQVEIQSAWELVEPMLDEALSMLSEADRNLVALRFFEGKNHAELASALGLSEETSRKRLSRAIERLRTFFSRRGVTVAAITLLAAVSQNAVQAAPAGLAMQATAAASGVGVNATVTMLVSNTLRLLTGVKLKVLVFSGTAALVVAIVPLVAVWHWSDQVTRAYDRGARLERYEFKATPVRYVCPGSPPVTMVSSPQFAGEPLLSAEFSWPVGPGNPGARAVRISTADEKGNEFEPVAQNSGGISDANGHQYWVGEAPVFPRRGKTVRLRLLSNANIIGEFEIPNPAPAPGAHATWTASHLPSSAAAQGLEATLVKFLARHVRETNKRSDLVSRTECVFTLRENAQATLDWRPTLFEISDATGNHWLAWPDSRFSGLEGFNVRCAFFGALWPGESAWKLRVEFRRIANFPKSELLRIPKIRIPVPQEIEEPHIQYDQNGVDLELAFIIGTDVAVDRLSMLNTETKKGCITIILAALQDILSQGKRLTFVGATDDQGRRVELAACREPGTPESPTPFSFVFEPPAGAHELNLEVAVSESRFLEFLAKPDQLKE